MRASRIPPPKGVREDVILFTVGAFRFAIAANAVSEIRNVEGLQQFSSGPGYNQAAKVEFTLERNGLTYFVVDAARHLHLQPTKPTRLLVLRHASAAVLVDSTDRMTEISVLHALPLAFHGDERKWYRGLAVLNGEVVPVVNHDAFLSKSETMVLRVRAEQLRGAAAAV